MALPDLTGAVGNGASALESEGEAAAEAEAEAEAEVEVEVVGAALETVRRDADWFKAACSRR